MKKLIACIIFSFLLASAFAIEPGQWDNFQDGTTQGWGSGAPNPNPPVVVQDGGPDEEGDAYLLVSANGGVGAGSMLITFNNSQWTGDYVSAGVTVISMHMNNFSDETLYMRIAVQGAGGNFWSGEPVILSPQSGWQIVQFSLLPDDLTGGTDANATLSNITQFRILHSVSGAYIGDIVDAELGIDNITAAENPLPVELVSFTVDQNASTIVLKWITATETNNLGFEIERKLYKNIGEEGWRIIGFREGAGTTTEKKNYIYYDNLTEVNTDKIAYRLKQVNFNGTFTFSNVVYVEKVVPIDFSLSQNFPNPFNPTTNFEFRLPAGKAGVSGFGLVTLKIYDVLGNEITTMVNEEKEPGEYKVHFDASHLPSGVYYYQLSAGSFSETKKMILLR
jgi:hypothetical protein